ncbi:Bardet-Biedl syndrome 7 protein homolog isoform X2 [Leptopilina heterotoma]|nr:Bardet-Biedl syndrome 7 protein homolog isoform X2 [Leptopilina heterotoma]XP_043478027.1 Bardet-Biedl syndrome 7 protein homolog isoform X2 [Leptopilina heterotoma]XP_043478028.1 Bardet-Biedl syndrome 7 protein homolog isoform X2 [Leptopilina heterotoma]XP_043478029.1 Bardet-Biedl syndrome 7 protein homolog isoform X2 [Leptopilina heterotoma]
MKKNELQLIFKSLPGPKINGLILGGAVDMIRDKIFICHSNTVKGFSKKGKLFLDFDTSLLDDITAIYVLGPDLAACSRDVYHRYRDCKDADSYLVGERLLDVVLLPAEGLAVYTVLACSDCAVRVLYGTKSPTIIRLPSVPSILKLFREDNVLSRNHVLMGTLDGKVGLLILETNKTVRVTWLLNDSSSEITALDTYVLQDTLDFIVGRQNGIVEVFAFPTDEEATPTLRFRYNCGESVSSLNGGVVGAIGFSEILVTTYSGRIFGLSTKPPGLMEAMQNQASISKLEQEIEQLQLKLTEERDTSNYVAENLVPLVLSVNYRMALNKADTSYSLSVELDTAIDNVLIQSDAPIELLDVESNNAVASLSICDPNEGNYVLATYRCQINTKMLEMRIRTIEGQSGTLQVYVTSDVQPKCCRKIIIPIYALSLHTRLHEEETPIGGPFNELKLNGNYSVAEMHAWLSLVLPEAPERPFLQEGEATLTYTSCFIGTNLKCIYKKGSATFLSENISTIIILRDVLTKEATKRKMKLDVFCEVSEASLTRVLEIILPRIKTAHDLTEKTMILDALEYWELKENPKKNLGTEYQEIVKNELNIRAQMINNKDILQRLNAVVIDLYVDWQRAKGSHRITNRVASGKLDSALKSMDLREILQIFLDRDIPCDIENLPSASRDQS